MIIEKIKLNKKYIILGLIVLCIAIVFLIYKDNKSSDQLIFKGSTSYIKKTDDQKKRLTIGLMNPPQDSRTYLGQDQTSQLTKRLVYEPILFIKKDLSIEYVLAKNIEFSADGLQAKVILNQNAKFSDAKALDAKTIKDTYLLLNSPNSQYTEKKLCENIQGIEEYWSGKAKDISGIIVNDDSEIIFKFNKASVLSLESLSIPIFKIVNDKQWALGTGEYQFLNYSHNKSLELKKNMYSHSSTYPFDKILIRAMSSITMKNDIEQFSLDIFEIPLESDLTAIKEAKYHNIYEMNNAYQMNYLEFNLNSQAGANKNIREAIYYSVNKSDLEKGFDKNERVNHSQLSSLYIPNSNHTYDLDKAQAALSKTKDTYTIDYFTLGDTASILKYDTIYKNLKKIGVDLKKSSNKNATMQYSSQEKVLPIIHLEENIMNSKLKDIYQEKLILSYQRNCRNVLKDLESYCQDEYITVPISTKTFGLAVSSDIDEANIRDLIINSLL